MKIVLSDEDINKCVQSVIKYYVQRSNNTSYHDIEAAAYHGLERSFERIIRMNKTCPKQQRSDIYLTMKAYIFRVVKKTVAYNTNHLSFDYNEHDEAGDILLTEEDIQVTDYNNTAAQNDLKTIMARARLTTQQRYIITEFYLQGVYLKDIAKILKVSHETVRLRRNAALEKLKQVTHHSEESRVIKYNGVSWRKDCSKWRCRMTYKNKSYVLGYFTDQLEAAKAYDKECLKLGKLRKLNFPRN